MIGLAPKTLDIIDSVSQLSCVKPFDLVGGTSISTQIHHRLSEDLDFCQWHKKVNAKNAVDFRSIEKELSAIGDMRTNHLGFGHVDFYVNGVKITFFIEEGYNPPLFDKIHLIGNIYNAPLELLSSMKVKTLFQRSTFRDYYDLYVMLKDSLVNIDKLIESSMSYDKNLNRKMISNRLRQWEFFKDEPKFQLLKPKYTITSEEIGHYFDSILH